LKFLASGKQGQIIQNIQKSKRSDNWKMRFLTFIDTCRRVEDVSLMMLTHLSPINHAFRGRTPTAHQPPMASAQKTMGR